MRIFAVGAAGTLLGCGIVQGSHNTRYFATERDGSKTIHLNNGR